MFYLLYKQVYPFASLTTKLVYWVACAPNPAFRFAQLFALRYASLTCAQERKGTFFFSTIFFWAILFFICINLACFFTLLSHNHKPACFLQQKNGLYRLRRVYFYYLATAHTSLVAIIIILLLVKFRFAPFSKQKNYNVARYARYCY